MTTNPLTKTDILRQMRLGDSRKITFYDPAELKSMSTLIFQFNRAEAKPKGYRITARYDYEALTVQLDALPMGKKLTPAKPITKPL